MNKTMILAGTIGFILGALVLGLVGFMAAPGLMITEDLSLYSFEETVQRIRDAAVAEGWKVPVVHEIDKSVAKAGYDVLPVSVIELCHASHAGKVLQADSDRVVSSMMPCRTSVYETSDGRVVISRMNTGLVSKVFGGTVASVMQDATADTERILRSVLQ